MKSEEKKYLKRKSKALANGNNEQIAFACNLLADFYNQSGDPRSALKEYILAMEFYDKINNKLSVAIAHRMIGEMYLSLYEFSNAKDHINDYFQMAKKLGNTVEEQRALVTLGRAYLLHGQWLNDKSAPDALAQFRQAGKYFTQGMGLIKKLSGKISTLEQFDMEARCCLNIGIVKENIGDLDESSLYVKKAIRICRMNDIYEVLHMSYTSMALLYHTKMNDCQKALRYCHLAFEVAKHLSLRNVKICETLQLQADILIKAGDFASARQTLAKAYRLNTTETDDHLNIEKTLKIVIKICQILDELVTVESNDFGKRKILFEKLGDGCCHIGNYNKAVEYYKKNLEYALLNNDSGKDLIPIYVSLYQTYKDNKEYKQALEYLWKEYELNKDIHHEAFHTLHSIAEILELQKQTFQDIYNVYIKAKEHAAKTIDDDKRYKLQKLVYNNIIKLCNKHNMDKLLEQMKQEADEKGIQCFIDNSEERSDSESGCTESPENNMDDWDNVSLSNLTVSETSDLEEEQQGDLRVPSKRSNRGTRTITIKRNNKGETQLHQACISGNLELVRRLIDQGHALNIRDHAGWLPLHEACNHGYRDIVEILLERGSLSSINDKGGTSCDGITPLYDACSNGYLDVVELLLDRGADVTLKTDFGETCLDGLERWHEMNDILESDEIHYNLLKERILKVFSQMGMTISKLKNDRKPSYQMGNRKREKERETEDLNCSSDESITGREAIDSLSLSISPKLSGKRTSFKRQSSSNNLEDMNARSDYKNVMEQMKHPQRHQLPKTESNVIKNRKITGYLQDDEVDADDWLVDAAGPEKKKRRYYQDPIVTEEISTALKQSSTSLLSSTATASTSLISLSKSQSTSQKPNRPNLSLKSQRSKRKQQTSLLDNGFSRFHNVSPTYSMLEEKETNLDTENGDNLSQLISNEPDSTTTSVQYTGLLQRSQEQNEIISFKVKIMEEMLLVPIEQRKLNDVNILWLAEEAARRYYNLVGLKPVIRLKTVDGFTYEENDPVIVVKEQNVLLGTVIEWKSCAIGQRYEEMCQKLQRDVNESIREHLEISQATNFLDISNCWFSPIDTEAVFKTLLHQNHIQILDFSNNFLQNEGCKQLSKCLHTLKQLRILNLCNNYITTEGIDALFSIEGGGNEKSKDICELKLEEIILSRNPIGNTSIRTLEKFLKHSKTSQTLRKLHISQCNITRIEVNCDLCCNLLQDIDISFNKIQWELLNVLLQKLKNSNLENLNINYSLQNSKDEMESRCNKKLSTFTTNAHILVELFPENMVWCKLKSLHLSRCNLTDLNMYKIIESLKNSTSLELLDLSDNVLLSATTLKFIFNKLMQLRELIFENCPNIIDEYCLQEIERKLMDGFKLPSYLALTLNTNLVDRVKLLWNSFWGDKAKILSSDANLILCTNDTYDSIFKSR